MTKSKAPRLAWVSALALIMAAGLTLAACGGSDGLTKSEEQALQDRLQAAENARRLAEQQRQQEQQRRQQAEQRNQQEQQARQQAEAERDAAEEERDEAQQTLDRFVAFEIVEAIPTTFAAGDTATDVLDVPSVTGILSYNEPVLATAPDATFTSTSTGSSSGWFTTTRSGSSEQRRDFVEIFSNVERPTSEDFRVYSARASDDVPRGVTTTLPWNGVTYDAQGRPSGHIDITDAIAGKIAESSQFPRPSTQRQGEKKTFTVIDRGPNQTEKDTALQAKADRDAEIATLRADNIDDSTQDLTPYDTSQPDYRLPVRNERYPERYSTEFSGTLQGAPGIFRCAGAASGGT